jgi:hypothetical protein
MQNFELKSDRLNFDSKRNKVEMLIDLEQIYFSYYDPEKKMIKEI